MIERQYCETERVAYPQDSAEFKQIVSEIEGMFGAQNWKAWVSVSTPAYNKILDDDVYSAVIRHWPNYLRQLPQKIGACGRKYLINKGWVYDKIYEMTDEKSCPLDRPDSATPLYLGYLVNVYGQPGDVDYSESYKDLYFCCPDHAAVEEWSGQQLPQGEVSTYYSAAFYNGELSRMKAYCYDNDKTPFDGWELTWINHAKKHGYEY